jgi:RNA polymerase sporulation-specific sigma factor
MILGELRRYLRDNGQLRVARSIRDTAYHAMQTKEKLQIQLQREPTVEEIAKAMEKLKEEIVLALESVVDPVSLSEPIYSDGGDTIYVEDQLGDNSNDKNWLDEIAMKEAIKNLSEREKRIVSLRFLRGKTQMEVAKEVGISQAQVSRLEKCALSKIKSVL